MSKSKSNIVETQISLIEDITNDVLNEVFNYFLRLKIFIKGGVINFIRNPKNQDYPGDRSSIIKIVDKFLNDAISEHYADLKKAGLNYYKLVYKSILNKLLNRGGN